MAIITLTDYGIVVSQVNEKRTSMLNGEYKINSLKWTPIMTPR